MDYPLPDARRVFESYLKRWNEFSGWVLEPADALLEWTENRVALASFELHSGLHPYREYAHTGCVGRVKYCVQKNAWADSDKVHWLNVLADYATFCGTGRKTTQGMGQTRRVRE
jgi:CRISPR-associated endoribonuclease Cas6